jgi:predicted enzyme related to lactoylglutathione lyase
MGSGAAYVEGFVPFVHVRDVPRSAAFYAHFGFEVRHVHEVRGRRVWCWLERHQARLMLAEASEPVDPGVQGVLFFLYAHDLEELHRRLTEAGLEPGPIVPGAPGPDREFGMLDPDGYCVMVTDAEALVPPG